LKKLKVNLGKRAYEIIIGARAIEVLGKQARCLKLGSDAYVVTNQLVKTLHGAKLAAVLKKSGITCKFKLIPDTERSKSLSAAGVLLKDLAGYDRNRRVFIIALGGGVVGDLAGFVAAVYKRGVPYAQVPTTLLAQVDSAIGGKTGVDLAEGKNLAGAFYQPRLVISDIDFLRTLNQRQLRNGMAEVVKYAAIKDPRLFAYLEKSSSALLAKDCSVLEPVVARCSAIKAGIVGRDEREEKGIRTILNFGHTLGHAIEAAGDYRGYSHGEAVALGMILAVQISKRVGLLNGRVCQRIETLIHSFGLPSRIGKLSLARIIRAYYKDKKFIGKTTRMVLLSGIGKPLVKENIPLAIVKEVLKHRA
jgi:3-dehydroquinate synthase